MVWLTAPLGPKGQITLPKEVRETLGLKTRGDLIGFALDRRTGSARLKRMEIRPVEGSYTEEELKKLVKVANREKGRKFASAKAFLNHLAKL